MVHERTGEVDAKSFVSLYQLKKMINDPIMVADYAKYLKSQTKKKGIDSAMIYVDLQVRFNGREPQHMVQPDIDLSAVDTSPFGDLSWIPPLKD